MQITLADYRSLAALNRDDLVLWAEAQRLKDEAEMRGREGQDA